MYALRVCMPYGYVCPMGMYTLWVCMPYGYVCPMGMYALRVCMPYGYVCPMGMYALRVCMPYGYKLCPAAEGDPPRGSNFKSRRLLTEDIFRSRISFAPQNK